jgi:hypothetical protein
MSVRGTIGGTIGATASVVRHIRWWLDWQARPNPAGGARGIE